MDVEFETINRAPRGFQGTCRRHGLTPRALHSYAPQEVLAPKHVTHDREFDARQQVRIELVLKRRSHRLKLEENRQLINLCDSNGPEAPAARWLEVLRGQSHYPRAERERRDINIDLIGDEAAHV